MTHRVATVHYAPGASDGPCDCTCAKWSGLASQFAAHRREVGAVAPDVRGGRALGPPQPTPAHIVASRRRGSAGEYRSQKVRGRELFTGCEPTGEAGLPCKNCGRLLMLGGKRTRDGQRRVQHAPQRGSAESRR